MSSIDPVDPAESLDAIGPHTVEVGPWQWRLVLYQRVAGGFMIFKGLTYWSGLFAYGEAGRSQFQELPLDAQASTVFFAVIDLVAGVALWLGSSWGAVLWLLAAALQLLSAVVIIEPTGILVLLTMIEILLVAGYVLVRFMAHAEWARRK